MDTTCQAKFLLDFDSLYCVLPVGHPGMHEDDVSEGRVAWQPAVT